jgi:signal transduction histidine kinase
MAEAATTAEKDPVLSQGAHEIRNPTAVILGYVRMLASERLGPLTDMQRKVLGDVATSTERLATLADEMSQLARLLGGSVKFARSRIDVAGLITEEIPSVGPALERDVQIRVENNFRGAVVNGDVQRLRSAFNWLMFSHRREIFTTDVLCVALDRGEETDPQTVRVTIAGADRLEEVRRLPPSELTALVEFRGGLGYKLSIARQVIEAHGGQVFSRIEPGPTPSASPLVIGAVIILPTA